MSLAVHATRQSKFLSERETRKKVARRKTAKRTMTVLLMIYFAVIVVVLCFVSQGRRGLLYCIYSELKSTSHLRKLLVLRSIRLADYRKQSP